MHEPNIEGNLRRYLGDRNAASRYSSFDYCFNYFQSHAATGRLNDLTTGEELQLSSLHLGFYLASWGMLRGSSQLLQRSVRAFVPVVDALVAAPAELWTLDVNDYSADAIECMLDFARVLRGALDHHASDILVTKIMLGTMGCVPAFDTYFKRGFGVATFGRKSLRKTQTFYQRHAEVIDAHMEPTLDFRTGLPTERQYTRAKVIDMIFFIEGMESRRT